MLSFTKDVENIRKSFIHTYITYSIIVVWLDHNLIHKFSIATFAKIVKILSKLNDFTFFISFFNWIKMKSFKDTLDGTLMISF